MDAFSYDWRSDEYVSTILYDETVQYVSKRTSNSTTFSISPRSDVKRDLISFVRPVWRSRLTIIARVRFSRHVKSLPFLPQFFDPPDFHLQHRSYKIRPNERTCYITFLHSLREILRSFRHAPRRASSFSTSECTTIDRVFNAAAIRWFILSFMLFGWWYQWDSTRALDATWSTRYPERVREDMFSLQLVVGQRLELFGVNVPLWARGLCLRVGVHEIYRRDDYLIFFCRR